MILRIAALIAALQNPCVVPAKGFFRIEAGAGGLFGVFAHDHLIEAQKIEGCVEGTRSVKLTFATDGVKVMDPKESAEDRAKVQKSMETEVLKVAEFPQVIFESTSIAPDGAGAGKYRVSGKLTIRGKSVAVVIPVAVTRLDDGSLKVTGNFKFKQTDFGIEPIKLMGGTVKVKDELKTEWELFLK